MAGGIPSRFLSHLLPCLLIGLDYMWTYLPNHDFWDKNKT